MDLQNVTTYVYPQDLAVVKNWDNGWAWLAGGTWIFSQAQPNLKVLVDLEKFAWSEIEMTPEGLYIGATCPMAKLRRAKFPEHWTSVKALFCAVDELASFKVTNMATVGGNICLALPASTFAPVMVALDASYEIWQSDASRRLVYARDFQTGAQQTILQPGEVLRKILIPQQSLESQINYQRICVATAGIAVSIVVTAYNPKISQVRFGLGACIPAPKVLEFDKLPTSAEIDTAIEKLPIADFIDDQIASASYRQYITKILMQRARVEF